MLRKTIAWPLSLSALLVLIVGACGGQDSSVSPESTTPAVFAPTAGPRPTVEGSNYYFPARGYAVSLPEGWTPSPDAITFGSIKTDVFTAPGGDAEAGSTTIVVQCSELVPLPTQDEWAARRGATYRALGADDLRDDGQVTVSGVDATAYSYSVATEKGTVAKTDLVFVGGRCAWVVSLGVPQAVDAVHARSVFEAFYLSFRLI